MQVVIAGDDVTTRECPNLAALVQAARKSAQQADPLHALWDAIHDAEEWLAGRPTLLPGDRNEVYATLVRTFQEASN